MERQPEKAIPSTRGLHSDLHLCIRDESRPSPACHSMAWAVLLPRALRDLLLSPLSAGAAWFDVAMSKRFATSVFSRCTAAGVRSDEWIETIGLNCGRARATRLRRNARALTRSWCVARKC